VFTGRRRVRLGDATPGRRARLDALARYLHDVAEDDAADVGLTPDIGWVLRKTRLSVRRFPMLGEAVRLDTFCSATASRWAQRTTIVTGDGGGWAQATSVWVAIDVATGTPARLGPRFRAAYGPSAGDRRASARLRLPPPPPDLATHGSPWPLRSSDFDIWGHVNNAISWAAVEDALGSLGRVDDLPLRAEVEHNDAIAPGAEPRLAVAPSDGAIDAWLVDGTRVLMSARVRVGEVE
jgi:acyl-ACP thioesterase